MGYRERQKRGQRDKTLNFITKEADCWQSAVSKHINGKLNERAKCGRRRYTIKRDNKGEQSPFQNMGRFTKLKSELHESPCTDVARTWATKSLLVLSHS